MVSTSVRIRTRVACSLDLTLLAQLGVAEARSERIARRRDERESHSAAHSGGAHLHA